MRAIADEMFDSDPRFYLSRMTLIALTVPGATRPVTEKLLPKLLRGAPSRRRLIRLALHIFGQPKEILEVAYEQFQRHGYEGRLMDAASLLADFGTDSWPALRSLAKSGAPMCQAFVGLIAGLKGVPSEERSAALRDLANNQDPTTRLRVLEALEELDPQYRRSILEALGRPDAPEDSACEAAREELGIGTTARQ
jgi:hypothetical protein